jgi:hypothetical protein
MVMARRVNGQWLIVMSTDNGTVLADLPIGEHVDGVNIDTGQIFVGCGDGTLAVVHETPPASPRSHRR